MDDVRIYDYALSPSEIQALMAPAAPPNLEATSAGAGTIQLSWSAASGPTTASYNVYRAATSGGPSSLIGTTTGTTYTDASLAPGPYYYRVNAAFSGGPTSPLSNEAPGLALPAAPGADGYVASDYEPESPTGNSPFGGLGLKTPFPAASQGGSVDLATGEQVARFPILEVDEPRGPNFVFELTHRSMGNEAGNASLSWDWDANWLQHLEASGADYLHHTGDGRTLRYISTGTGYDGPPGTYTRLVSVAGKLELQDRDGNRRVFDPANALKLTDTYDAAGNHWSLAYGSDGKLDSITDPLGRTILLSYAPSANGRLTGITDFAGRAATLDYDIPSGHLQAVRTPAMGGQFATRFTYDANHRISSVLDNAGARYVQMAYDTFGRTLRQVDGEGPARFFAYYHDAGVTQTWDANGNRVDWHFPTGGAPRVVATSKVEFTRGLRTGDPASYTTAFTHNAQDELTGVTYPAGNSVAFVYDEAASSVLARGNLLSKTESPGSVPASSLQSTSQASLATTSTYDATCNKATTITDPRGLTTHVYYDVQEATLGDKNGDGVTTQAACNVVRIEHPTVNPSGVPNPLFSTAYANQAIVETFTYNAAGQLLSHTDPNGVQESRTYYAAPASAGKPVGYLQTVTKDAGTSPHLSLATTFEYTDFGTVNKVTDPNGKVRTFAVDLRGRTTQETGPVLPLGSIHTVSTYDANDNLVKVQHEKDAGTGTYTSQDYAYDALDRLVSETAHPSATHAITTTYAYDGNGNLVKKTGGAGELQTSTYDERNLLLSKSGPRGGTFAYDGNGNLKTFADPLGHATSYQVDGYDRLAVKTDAAGSQFVTSYDADGNIVMEKGLGGTSGKVLYERTHAYDESSRAYQDQEWMQAADTMPPNAASGNLGAAGRWVSTLHEFDARGQETRSINDNAHVTANAYDNVGRLASTTDAVGNVAQRKYDGNGNLIEVKQTVAGATSTTCPQVCTTTYDYDAENRLITTHNPDSTTQASLYDGRGNVIKTTDANGHSTVYTYDDADRMTQVDRATGTTPAYVTTTTAWDDEGRMQSQCDGGSQCTAYTYVAGTQLVASETPPSPSPGVTNAYDAAGNVRTAAYSSGKVVSFGYDSLNRPTSIDASGLPANSGTTHQSFTYDDLGRVTQATDDGVLRLGSDIQTSLGVIGQPLASTQQFDTLGRVVAESQIASSLTVRHTLDGVGNDVDTSYPSLTPRTVSHSYDARERLDRAWDSKGLLVDYAYQGDRVAGKDFGGATPSPAASGTTAPVAKTVVSYNGAERPYSIQHKAGATTLADVTTRYDNAGNRLAQKLQGNTAAASDAYSQLYVLNALDQTTSWKKGPIDSTLTSITATPQMWSVNAKNEWTMWGASGACTRTTGTTGSPVVRQVNDAACPAAATYTFDVNGNLATDGTLTYKWDAFNRLIRVNDGSGKLVVAYAYDAFGRRVFKVFPDNVATIGGSQANKEGWYTFAGQHVVQESQPFGSIQPVSVPPTAPSVHVIRQWVYGPGVDEVVAMDWDKDGDQNPIGTADARYFYAYDSAGNVLGLLSETGHLVEGYVYQPYGDPTILTPCVGTVLACPSGTSDVHFDVYDTVSTGKYGSSSTLKPYSPNGNLWFFTGRQYDPEIGAYNYRAREYHPTLGQFMSMDPIGTWGDAGNLGNAYAYVGNNPGSHHDPSGMYAGVDDAAACGIGAAGAVGFNALNGVASFIGGLLGHGWSTDQSLQNYAGQAVGGCLGGAAFEYSGPVGSGLAYGAASGGVTHGLNILSGAEKADLGSYVDNVAMDTVIGGAFGAGAEVLGQAGRALSRSLAENGFDSFARFAADQSAETALLPRLGKSAEAGPGRNVGSLSSDGQGEFARQLSKYGKGGVHALENGRYRFYGEFRKARTPGQMAGAQTVREWDPATDNAFTWLETLDQVGRVRQVRPQLGPINVHYGFDESGQYTGYWLGEW
jgi:RHS repeat-associated protein